MSAPDLGAWAQSVPRPPRRLDDIDEVAVERAYTAAWLAEMWPVCREISRERRETMRDEGRAMVRQIEEHVALSAPSPLPVQESPEISTTCAEVGSESVSASADDFHVDESRPRGRQLDAADQSRGLAS